MDAALDRLRALISLGNVGPPGPPGPPPTEVAVGYRFTFATPSVVTLASVSPGYQFNKAIVLVETPFNAPASLKLGISANPALLLDVGDSRLTIAGQYHSDALVPVYAPDVLQLFLNAAGATQGSGYVFYRYLV
jgi:hypothetical protein